MATTHIEYPQTIRPYVDKMANGTATITDLCAAANWAMFESDFAGEERVPASRIIQAILHGYNNVIGLPVTLVR